MEGAHEQTSDRPSAGEQAPDHDLNLVGDDELIALLDAYPRERLQAFTMGTDRCRRDDWHYGDSSTASGKEIFTAMLSGRLWLNLLRVDRRCGDVIRQLISDLQQQCKRLGLLSINFGTLLISSPSAMVYYHFDANHQAPWHLRGSKRIWLYPACDDRIHLQVLRIAAGRPLPFRQGFSPVGR